MTITKHLTWVAAGLLALTACAGPTASAPSPSTPAALTESSTLTVVTHDSFGLSKPLLEKFKSDTGYTVTMVAPGDAGTVLNQLVLTKDSPIGDVVFGIDNTFAGRALSQGVVAPYTPATLPASAADLQADASGRLTPIDFGDVCLNADKEWFAAKKLALPATLEDLLKPEYADLLVVENPASSSPGLAFLAATVAAKGEAGYLEYWKALKANGVKVAKGWTEAYTVDFSGSAGKGPRPLVVSYATSPSAEVPEGSDESRTTSLLATCFRQVEYAGVISGAQNEVGARKFIDFLLSDAVQADIPGQMYMYPANRTISLPPEWAQFAPLADQPWALSTELIASQRDTWIRAWTSTVIG
ncbi:MAG: thiamine ABC transporter substrate-binding protein [Micropruina sp.]